MLWIQIHTLNLNPDPGFWPNLNPEPGPDPDPGPDPGPDPRVIQSILNEKILNNCREK